MRVADYRQASCTAGVATLEASCVGTGTCPAAQTKVCAPYICSGTQCGGNCTVDSDCPSASQFCSAGICQAKLSNGQV